jgi:hypothetical protein
MDTTDQYYLLTPWSRVLEKLTGSQLFKKFPTFYGTQRFIITLTSTDTEVFKDHPIICKLFVTYNGIQHQKVTGMPISMPADTSFLLPGT